MSYEDVVNDVVKVVEVVGGGIMVVGGFVALTRYAQQVVTHTPDAYVQLRREPRDA